MPLRQTFYKYCVEKKKGGVLDTSAMLIALQAKVVTSGKLIFKPVVPSKGV